MRKLATGAISFGAAIFAAAYFLPLQWALTLAVVLAAGACICMAFTFKWRLRCVIALLCAALGLCWIRCYHQIFITPIDQLDGQTTRISATITDFSTETDFGMRIPAKIAISGKYYSAYIYYDDPEISLQPGDAVGLTARLSRAESAANDDSLIYTSHGIVLRAFAVSDMNIYHPEKTPLRYLPLYAAKRMAQAMEQVFESQMVPFIKALVLGDKSEMDDGFVLDISRSGMQHIFVVSGMHVGFLISLLSLLIPQRKLIATIGSILLLFFAAMVGMTPSVMRATTTHLFTLLAPLARREKDDITSLAFILALLLMQNPYSIADPALQLSFASAAGMTIFTPAIHRRIKGELAKFTSNPLVKFITASVSSSLGVMILGIPAMCIIFRQVNLLAIISNLLTLWAFEICFIIGIIAPLAALVFLPLGKLLAFCTYPLYLYIRSVLKLLANIPFCVMSTSNILIMVWLIFTYTLGVLSIKLKNRRPWVQTCCSIFLLGAFLLASWRYEMTSALTFTALNVGQGQCLVLTSMGHTVVIDCGGTNRPAETLLTYLGDIQQTKLDALILTHYHNDHALYVPQVLDAISTDLVILPSMDDSTGNKFSTIYSALSSDAQVELIDSDSTLTFGCCTLEIFAPMDIGQENERCLSMVISCGDTDILVTGDMSSQQEGWLADTRDLPDCEVLVCGHHGSKYATSDYFLETTTPETAVISVGYNNYGHPAEDTLQRLEDHGVEVLRTDESGNITIRYREAKDNG